MGTTRSPQRAHCVQKMVPMLWKAAVEIYHDLLGHPAHVLSPQACGACLILKQWLGRKQSEYESGSFPVVPMQGRAACPIKGDPT